MKTTNIVHVVFMNDAPIGATHSSADVSAIIDKLAERYWDTHKANLRSEHSNYKQFRRNVYWYSHAVPMEIL